MLFLEVDDGLEGGGAGCAVDAGGVVAGFLEFLLGVGHGADEAWLGGRFWGGCR